MRDILDGISGIPENPMEITLYAEDGEGNILEDSILVPVIDPQCTALEAIDLREGPNTGFQQVGQIPQDTVVTVTAQDTEAGWLRVQLPGEVRGWAMREFLTCADTFNLSDLRKEVNLPPLPTMTPIPSATSTPLPAATQTITPSQALQATSTAIRALASPTPGN